jgi:RNA 2',3'-cyclic 3'-phosphodiesterase
METLRTFVAVELPQEIRGLLAAKQDELRAAMGRAAGAVRWSRSEGVHLTLQFLGDVPADLISRIADAVRQGCTGQEPLELILGRTSAFPGLTRPRVLWMGLEGETGRLQMLQTHISDRLSELGYRPDKPFQPHVTLGRVRDTVRRDELETISWALRQQENKPIERRPFTAYHVSLMKSELRPGGSVYTELAGIELE